MRYLGQSAKFMIMPVILGLMSGTASQAAAKPLKVFVLAGQSNMQGHASVSTFDSMADDPRTAPLLEEIAQCRRHTTGVREGLDFVDRLPRRCLF